MEGFNHQVINISNIVVCAYHKTFQESYLVSQESYLVWECSVVYDFISQYISVHFSAFQCIVCLEYVLNLWDSVILLKFLEMNSCKWMVTGGHV